MALKYCIVEGCFSASNPKLQFFCIPRGPPDRRKAWIEFAGRNVKISRFSRICSLHFSPDSYSNSITLKTTALPTLKPAPFPASSTPTPGPLLPPITPSPVPSLPVSSTPTPGPHSPPLLSSPALSLPASRPLQSSPLSAACGNESASPLVSAEDLEMQRFPRKVPAEESITLAPRGETRRTSLTPRKILLKRRVEQQAVTSIQNHIEDHSMLSSQSLVLEGVNIESETEWSDASLAILANQICRICAHQNDNLFPIFEEQSIQLRVLDKIQWHLPIVVREDDKLPLKICRRCIARLDSWHDMISLCVAADSKLRKMFKVGEEIDPLQTQKHEERAVVKLPEGQRPVTVQILPVEEAEIKSESPEGLIVNHSRGLLVKGAMGAQSLAGLPAVPVNDVEVPTFEKQTQEEQTMPAPFEVNTIMEELEAEVEEEERAGEGAEMEGFRCTWCPYVTSQKKSLEQHMARLHMPPPAIFSYCDKTFSSKEAGNARKRVRVKDAKPPCFKCKACARSFCSKKTLKEHKIAEHSSEKSFQCDKCAKNYSCRSSFDIHRATHSSETPYLCDLCGKTFKHVSNLRCHKRSHLSVSDKNRQICLKCNKRFRTRFRLSEHMNVHNNIRPYICERCGKRFHRQDVLQQHNSLVHSETQPYKCHVCGAKFNKRGNMTQHVKRHAQEHKYTCRVCEESFPTLGAVLKHRRNHSKAEVERSVATHATTVDGDDPDQVAFKCKVCDKLLAKKEYLKSHMRSHTVNELFKCSECGKHLSTKGSLTYHIRSFHTGERPFQCKFCSKSFLSRESWRAHERIHTGEKPYECLVCSKAFRCSSYLAQHSRVHSDARPHTCQHCGECFLRKGALDVHMRTHTVDPHATVQPLAAVEPLTAVDPPATVQPLTAVEPAATTVTVTRQEDLPP